MGWQNQTVNGLLPLDKPAGFTSFDVCAVVRGMLRTKKVGHAGTLDPMATGVLPVLVGSATRALEYIPSHDKTYEASFRFGVTTDTLDVTGRVLSETPLAPGSVTEGALRQVLERFTGEILQVPPMYSAVSVNGKKLYDLARQGVEVERKARSVTVYRLTLDSYDPAAAAGRFTVCCSRGTYVRSLIADIGQALGCGAILTALRRTEASGISVGQCMTLVQAQAYTDEGTLADRLVPVDRFFTSYPALYLSDAQCVRFRNGAGLALDRLYPPVIDDVRQQTRLQDDCYPQESVYRVYATASRDFLGLGVKREDELRVLKQF